MKKGQSFIELTYLFMKKKRNDTTSDTSMDE